MVLSKDFTERDQLCWTVVFLELKTAECDHTVYIESGIVHGTVSSTSKIQIDDSYGTVLQVYSIL